MSQWVPVAVNVILNVWNLIKSKVRIPRRHREKLEWYLMKGEHLTHFKNEIINSIDLLNEGKVDYPNSSMIYYSLARAYCACEPPEINAARAAIREIDNTLGSSIERIKEELLEELTTIQASSATV